MTTADQFDNSLHARHFNRMNFYVASGKVRQQNGLLVESEGAGGAIHTQLAEIKRALPTGPMPAEDL